MESENFEKLSFLPLPLLFPSKEHYCPFSELYGSIPSEKDRPSLEQIGDADAIEADSRHKPLFNSSKVRSVIHCQECFKPRCVFASQKLQWNEKLLVKEVADEKLYTCGSSLFEPNSPLVDSVVVRRNIGCTTPIESQYFSAKLVSFPPVCYYCGVSEESFVDDATIHQLRQEYAVVRPICFLCQSEGKKPFVKMPTNVKKRPRLQ